MLSMFLLFCFVIFWMLCCVMCEKKKKMLITTKKKEYIFITLSFLPKILTPGIVPQRNIPGFWQGKIGKFLLISCY